MILKIKMDEKMKNLIILIISMLIFTSCGSENDNDSTSNNLDFIGQWTLTFSGTYEGNECSGDLMGSGDGSTNGSSFVTLYEDGTCLSTDNFFCTEPDNVDDPNCQGTWSSNSSEIIITSFFPITYTVEEDNGIRTMTTELQGEMTSNGVTTETCSKSIYTQQ